MRARGVCHLYCMTLQLVIRMRCSMGCSVLYRCKIELFLKSRSHICSFRRPPLVAVVTLFTCHDLKIHLSSCSSYVAPIARLTVYFIYFDTLQCARVPNIAESPLLLPHPHQLPKGNWTEWNDVKILDMLH